MKKRKILLGVLLASTAFCMAACTNNSSTNNNDNNNSSDTGGNGQGEQTEQFTVTFKLNNGSADTTVQVDKGGKVTKPADPSKAADTENTYTFDNWYKDQACTQVFNFETETINASTTIYAKYNAIANQPIETKSITMNGVEYTTIANAFAAIPTSGDTSTYTITLGKGTYTENDLKYKGTASIRIIGDTTTKYGADVIIKGHGSGTGNKDRCTFEFEGSGNIILENVTLINDWTRATAEKQAETLGSDTTGYTVAYNCAFKSYQDTLRTVGKSWFYGCYIEGDTDFLWMESSGIVALYEKCEIVSVYDPTKTGSHETYVTAPRANITSKVGKGLVIYNSVVKESDEAKANGQKTYLARTPWNKDYYNQVAYINTTCSDIETAIWKDSSIPNDYPETVIGWKMDQATATSLGYAGNGDILDADTVSKEFNGRRAILNRLYNTAKGKYEKDDEVFDVDSLIESNSYTVDNDTSKILLDGETESQSVTYLFDGTENDKVDSMCSGFAQESGKAHYVGKPSSGTNPTITIPVTGKCTVTVIGYYKGVALASAGEQGESVMEFDTGGSTSITRERVYTVYSDNVENVVIEAVSETYIKKIIVEYDDTIEYVPVSSIEVNASSDNYTVGVALNLTATITPTNATNSNVKWTSSDNTIATIDEYSGKVTFLKAGEEVTFTATARDGSGKTGTFTCTAEEATWTACEWYTTDGEVKTEEKADGIGNFNTNGSSNKSLGATYTFTNLAGQAVPTTYGLKLNGSGMLTISTTNEATLVLITTKAVGTLVTDDPMVTNGTTTLTYTSKVESGNNVTYTYRLTSASTWNISRSGTKESQPIIYAKCVYDAVWDFRDGGTPSTMTAVDIQKTTGTVVSNHSSISLTVDASNDGKLTYNTAGYAQFNKDTIIQVPVANVGSVITVTAFPGQYNYTVAGTAATANDTIYKVTAEDVERGYIEIIATDTAYIYAITLTNPR